MKDLILWEILMIKDAQAEFGKSYKDQKRLEYLREALKDWEKVEQKLEELKGNTVSVSSKHWGVIGDDGKEVSGKSK